MVRIIVGKYINPKPKNQTLDRVSTTTKARERLRTRSIVDPSTDCWIWQQYKSKTGWPLMSYASRTGYAVTTAYKLFIGPPPERHNPLMTCGRRDCINPHHVQWTPKRKYVTNTDFEWQSAIHKFITQNVERIPYNAKQMQPGDLYTAYETWRIAHMPNVPVISQRKFTCYIYNNAFNGLSIQRSFHSCGRDWLNVQLINGEIQ